MSPRRAAALLALTGAVCTAAVSVQAHALIGTYQGSGCTGRDRLVQHESWLGRPVDLVLDGPAQDSWKSLVATTGWLARCWAPTGRQLVISLPMLPADGSTLSGGAQGDYDDHFRQVAQILRDQGQSGAIIRIGFEFNARWFRWNSLKEPQVWVAYWRRIVATMREVPDTRFRFDWSPIVGAGAASPEPAYPGDDVVDLIGADVYNGNWNPELTPQQRWELLRDAPFGLKWHERFAAAHGKPMSFPEWGTGTRPDGHGGGDDPLFMSRMVEWIAAHPVAYHIYWDYRARDYDGKLSDGRQPQSEAVFLKAYGGAR
ncbi:glycoside hydrolase family 26 protein [Aquincola sp. J276]|uniref:glycoside hydrolase family 26 protein n=1 Tax=Aquincola sp. J276 TaxID=2898432 RepID=UPI002151F634|nr:glycosyl hydrolase [Aquincola sp. J276]MCR5868797.1 hypothetical protein [Aquincola sp. J276]